MDGPVVSAVCDMSAGPTSRLLGWITQPSAARGIYFARDPDGWDFCSYAQLAASCQLTAAALMHRGLSRNGKVLIALGSGPHFVAAFFGTLLAGGTPAPIAAPSRLMSAERYSNYLRHALEASQAALAITQSAELMTDGALAGTGCVATSIEQLLSLSGLEAAPPSQARADLALLQFTSGSSGSRRAARIGFDALAANVAAIHRWLDWQADDVFASWLPLHHDMGLVGALVCATVAQSDLMLMRPEQFVRSPLRYLRCFAQRKATLGVTANFAIEYLVRHITPRMLQGFDFRHWKALVVGAERVDLHALRAFERLLWPHAFAPTTLLPAYGMAEASLAISGTPLRTRWHALDPTSMTPVTAPGDSAEGSPIPVVSCGKPLEGVLVEIVDSAGRALPDQQIGEIVVRSRSLAQGYQQSSESLSLTRFIQGRLFTGDIGFTDGGELFVLGRLGDSLKIRGQFVFGEDLEIAAAHVGVPRERIAALLGYHEGRATAVLLVERYGYLRSAVEAAVRHLVEGAQLLFLDAPPGSILRTTSGKPKRRELWEAYTDGRLPAGRTGTLE